MRLTHLKLAGFKSFVDATTLNIHGQRVGVVGPNGCGKSNVMESVRWVLGESSAKELRGENMDSVIFNGSGNRKPISRASVELIFDNSLGSAAGEWSQYAEISVKRVIEREKGSTYYINNSVVRKRDVADLFLGTGLGGRAYAIIGQNTINRIVEAKPEEMRVFLEEAAGISKYKERRRETELRLRDTRENLTRVDDILRELDKQISRLETQAEVAEKFGNMQALLDETKGQIWLLKKHKAYDKWQSSQRNVEKLVNDLEAQVASLRHNENALETARQNHIEAADAMNVAQTQYYEVNAEVSGLESQIKSAQDSNERMKMQLQQFASQSEKNISQRQEVEEALIVATEKLENLTQDFTDTEQAIAEAKETFSLKSQEFHTILEMFNARMSTLTTTEQSLRIEQTNVQHLQKSLNEVDLQVTRLTEKAGQIESPDDEEVNILDEQVSEAQGKMVALEESVSAMQAQEQSLNDALRNKRDEQQTQQKALHTLEAEIASLTKIQASVRSGASEGDFNQWLQAANLENCVRIWQTIRMKAGWETALEASLNGRLNAIINDEITQQSRPPNALTLVKSRNSGPAFSPKNIKAEPNKTNLLSLVESIAPEVSDIVQGWLRGVFVAADAPEALSIVALLADGEVCVTPEGDIYTKDSVTYFGPQSALHGVLERQVELDRLQQEYPEVQDQVAIVKSEVQTLESSLVNLRNDLQQVNSQLRALNQETHQATLQLQQIKQQQQNAIARKATLEQDITSAKNRQSDLVHELEEQQHKIGEVSVEINQLRQQKQDVESKKDIAESERNASRNEMQSLDKTHQEKRFNLQITRNSINELTDKLTYLNEEHATVDARQQELNEALSATNVTDFLNALEILINKKASFESSLTDTRNAHSECETALRELERERMQNEQQLHPLRDKLEASRLADQEARIYYEQCVEELSASTITEEVLAELLAKLNADRADNPYSIKDLQIKKDKLTRQIDGLGAVNLAAIEELNAEKTRHGLLSQQSADLTEASDTLENAIRKIDKETRGRLQATYEEANRHFSELFKTIFNGGQARLELLGDEILDTGIQVFAQPPGKKNSTIHLLSGGEKAMTAIALVFALFRLNPAPFCLMDEVDAPLDDSNTERFCAMVKKMSEKTQFMYVSHNKITMEMAQQLIGVTMQESGVSRIVDVDMEEAVKMVGEAAL